MSRNLERGLAYFEKHSDKDPDHVLACWRAMTGASIRFRNGTHELSYCGVRGTATSGAAQQLIRSWCRAARRKLDARKGGQS